MIIDFHTHTFPEKIAHRVLEELSAKGHTAYRSDGTPGGLAGSMERAGIDLSVNLPVITRAGQAAGVNEKLARRMDEMRRMGIVSFGGLHPEDPDWKEDLAFLKREGFPGMKLHPGFQRRHINDIVYKRMIAAAGEAGLIVLLHTGLDFGIPEENYASVRELLDVIEDVQPEKLVLAHMGAWQCWDEVELYLAGAPVWFDTSYSVGRFRPREGEAEQLAFSEGLGYERFVRLMRSHGTGRVLFGTDSPWADQEEYMEHMNCLDLTPQEREQIMGENARKLLELS